MFVGVGRRALREGLDEAASGGRGVEKQDATGFAAGVLPSVRYGLATEEFHCKGAAGRR